MKAVVFRVFLFDGASKMFLAASSLMLIKYLPVDEYSAFITVFTYAMLVYQGVCSVIERLYIAEHAQYMLHQIGVKYLLLLVGCGGFSFYVFFFQGLLAGLMFLLLVLISVNYQVERIKLQKSEKYSEFMLVEFFRNLSWFLLVVVAVLFAKESAGYVSLMGYALSTGVMFIFVKKISKRAHEADYGCIVQKDIVSAVRYLGRKKSILSYSAITAIFPYLAFIMVGILGDDMLTATYGAALRYQAIFSIAVYAANAVLIAKMANNVGHEKRILSDFKGVLPWLLLAAVSASMLVWWLIPIIDNGKYPGAQTCFVIMVFYSLCALLATPFVNILLANNLYTKMLFSLIAGLIVFAALLPVLYTQSRYFGILYALASAYFTILCCNVFFANKQILNESINS